MDGRASLSTLLAASNVAVVTASKICLWLRRNRSARDWATSSSVMPPLLSSACLQHMTLRATSETSERNRDDCRSVFVGNPCLPALEDDGIGYFRQSSQELPVRKSHLLDSATGRRRPHEARRVSATLRERPQPTPNRSRWKDQQPGQLDMKNRLLQLVCDPGRDRVLRQSSGDTT